MRDLKWTLDLPELILNVALQLLTPSAPPRFALG